MTRLFGPALRPVPHRKQLFVVYCAALIGTYQLNQRPQGEELLSGQAKSYCSHLDGYSVVTFRKEIRKASLDEIREAGEQVVSELAHHKTPQCLVDLTDLDYMGSSLVASIVRIWKAIEASQGRMVVAVSGIGVREVLRVTGLDRVWTIKTSYEAALHELGFSSQAKIVKRELRLLAFVGPATLLVGGIAAALSRVPVLAALSQPPDWVAYSLVAVAVITSCISIFREHSWRRWLSVFVFLVAAPLLGWLIWTAVTPDSDSNSLENGESVETGEKQVGSEEFNKTFTPEKPSNNIPDKPPTSSPDNSTSVVAPADDSDPLKPVPESSPSNSSSSPPTSPPTTSNELPATKSTPDTDPPPQS